MLTYGDFGPTFLTSTGHVVGIGWDGEMAPSQIYYAGDGCTGTALLNAGGPNSPPIFGKIVVLAGTPNKLMVPSNVAATVSASVSFSSRSIDNPTCGVSIGTRNGWPLMVASTADVGLPSFPIAGPVRMQ